MLRWRLILGTLFIAALVGLCWLDYRATPPGVFLLPVAVALSLLGTGELLAMFRKRGQEPLPWVVYSGTLIAVLTAAAPGLLPSNRLGGSVVGELGWLAVGLTAGLLLAVVGELSRFESSGPPTANLAHSCFAIMYIGGLMGFMVQLRLWGGPAGNDGRWGMLALVSLVATVKMSDTGQFWVGRRFGRRKLAPVISPGKTWEGAAGGVIVAIVTAWIVFTWGARGIVGKSALGTAPVAICLFGVTVAVAGILGDLAESMLKRDAGVKDSSSWLPGFGGVLDVLDSLLGAAPVAYLFWALGIVGP